MSNEWLNNSSAACAASGSPGTLLKSQESTPEDFIKNDTVMEGSGPFLIPLWRTSTRSLTISMDSVREIVKRHVGYYPELSDRILRDLYWEAD